MLKPQFLFLCFLSLFAVTQSQLSVSSFTFPSPIIPGTNASFSAQIHNSGLVDLNTVSCSITFPQSISPLISYPTQCSESDPLIACSIPPIQANSTHDFDVNFAFPADMEETNGSVPLTIQCMDTSLSSGIINSVSPFMIEPHFDFVVELTSEVSYFHAGEHIEIAATVSNNGPSDYESHHGENYLCVLSGWESYLEIEAISSDEAMCAANACIFEHIHAYETLPVDIDLAVHVEHSSEEDHHDDHSEEDDHHDDHDDHGHKKREEDHDDHGHDDHGHEEGEEFRNQTIVLVWECTYSHDRTVATALPLVVEIEEEHSDEHKHSSLARVEIAGIVLAIVIVLFACVLLIAGIILKFYLSGRKVAVRQERTDTV